MENFQINNRSCFVEGIIGDTSAIRLAATLQQYFQIAYLYDFRNVSFSITSWIYAYNLQNQQPTIFAQCGQHIISKCLYLRLSNRKMVFSFFNGSQQGRTILVVNRWYHVAFVYNYTSQTQILYLDGLEDGRGSQGAYLGEPGNITIGRALATNGYYFDGIIDRISIVNQAMTANDVLIEATLSAYYSFNITYEIDSGPNQNNGSGYNVAVTNGFIGQSIEFYGYGNDSYFQARNFLLLGTSNRSYSFAFWIRTDYSHFNGSIIYMTSANNWCLPTLGFSSNGSIIAQSSNGTIQEIIGLPLIDNTWTHIALTYQSGDKLSLYQNGTLVGDTNPFIYTANESPVTVTLGYLQSQTNCISNLIIPGPFAGEIDEFRIYSRCLNELDIQELLL